MLESAIAITKLPCQDLDRARRFYRDVLGLEAAEERPGGLRYVCGSSEFHLFASSGQPSGASTQMGFEVDDIVAVVKTLRARGLQLERVDVPHLRADGDLIAVDGNYPSKGTGERGAFFRDSEGNVIGLGEATGLASGPANLLA